VSVEVTFQESSATERVASLPLSHLSLELGHLYMEDFAGGPPRLRELFRQVAPWARAAQELCASEVKPKTPRISTCFLIDDYFTKFSSPREVLPMLLEAAQAAGMRIDYVAREAACAEADGVPLASLVTGRLVADPPPGSDGSRPPVHDSGWLCNGTRSPQQALDEAMTPHATWLPPSENGANRHSIFIDVELWDEPGARRQWSCPFLAAVWQLLRLGLLRDMGEPVAVPRPVDKDLPELWEDLPPVTQLNPRAAPFCAYRTYSVLADRFLPVEHAVRTILSQVTVERAVASQLLDRAGGEGLRLPFEVVERVGYVFTGPAWR
jgi:hypothetical protein